MQESADYGTIKSSHNCSSSGSFPGAPLKNVADNKTDLAESDPLISSPDNGDYGAPHMSPVRAHLTIATLTVLTLVGSMSTGVLNISIPKIQEELQLPEGFVLW